MAKYYVDLFLLEKADACTSGIVDFLAAFGDTRVGVTAANVRFAAKHNLSFYFGWLFLKADKKNGTHLYGDYYDSKEYSIFGRDQANAAIYALKKNGYL